MFYKRIFFIVSFILFSQFGFSQNDFSSPKEFDAVIRGVGGIDALIDWNSNHAEVTNMKYMEDVRTKEDKVYDNPLLCKTPVVRNGKFVTVGYCPEIWGQWE